MRDSRGAEVDRDCHEVTEGAGHDGIRPRTEKNERYVEMDALCRVRGLGGHVIEEVEPRDIEGEWERESNGDSIEMDGRRRRMDGARSGARRDLTRNESDCNR